MTWTQIDDGLNSARRPCPARYQTPRWAYGSACACTPHTSSASPHSTRIRPHGRALAERQRTTGDGTGGRGNARTGARRRPVDGGRGRHLMNSAAPPAANSRRKSQGRACRRRRFGRGSSKQTRSNASKQTKQVLQANHEAKPKQTMKQTVKQTMKQNRSKRLKQNEAIASKQTKQPVLLTYLHSTSPVAPPHRTPNRSRPSRAKPWPNPATPGR